MLSKNISYFAVKTFYTRHMERCYLQKALVAFDIHELYDIHELHCGIDVYEKKFLALVFNCLVA